MGSALTPDTPGHAIRRGAAAIFLLLLPALMAGRSEAQSCLHAYLDVTAVHDYRWRGIERASGWNGELQGTARFGGRATTLAAGVWSNVELGTHRDGALTDLRPATWGLSEADFWGELAHTFSGGDVAAGFIWYEYRGRAGRIGTGEVYGRLRGSGQSTRRIAPEISIWYDVAKRKSAYLEAGATVPVLALPLRGVGLLAYAAGTAGFALGQPERRSQLAATTFEDTGFTSADLSLGLRLAGQRSLGGMLFNLAGHVQVADDPATRRKRLNPSETSGHVRGFITLGVGLRWPAPEDR